MRPLSRLITSMAFLASSSMALYIPENVDHKATIFSLQLRFGLRLAHE